jgi:hypothetical protein
MFPALVAHGGCGVRPPLTEILVDDHQAVDLGVGLGQSGFQVSDEGIVSVAEWVRVFPISDAPVIVSLSALMAVTEYPATFDPLCVSGGHASSGSITLFHGP